MRKTGNSSKKSSGATINLVSPDFRAPRTTPAYGQFVSEDGEVHDGVLVIKRPEDWGDRLYQDHPLTTSIEDFISELYKEGYEESIRLGRREFGDFLEKTGKKNLRNIRLKKGLSQEELAKQAGVQQYQVSRYESGSDYPGLPTMRRLCNVLEIDANTLFEALEESK